MHYVPAAASKVIFGDLGIVDASDIEKQSLAVMAAAYEI